MNRPRPHAARNVGVLLTASVVLVFAMLAATASGASRPRHATLAGSPLTATDWNSIAVATVRAATPTKFQVEGLIYMSYVQTSVYDAVTKIEGRYQPYHDFAAPVATAGASPDAAVAAAAYTALAYYFPAQATTLTTTYTTYLAGLPAAGRDAGAAIGSAAAQDIIRLRTGDGRDAFISTPYGQGPLTPGVWTFAPPPSAQSAQTPWVAFTRPFTLESPSQFRPGPPLSITSHKYATQLAELEAYGGATSTVRTAEQTDIAQFWNANAINQVNQTQRDLASAHGFDLVDTARGLAMANVVDSDAGIACFDAKYHYTFWRPVTAIQHADIDGNDLTTADPTWTPLLTTPNHPEYPAAHGCITSSDAEVSAKLLDTHRLEIDIPGAVGRNVTTLTTSRHYSTVEALDREIVNARVWAGLHYRDSGEAGVKLGRDVAHWALDRYFLPAG
ncbi:MAG: hypothetical protein QOI27_559 [Gaiellaceae bacterium]|jgi:hypothetical protein|nr:hypothetical protein [Gaiellaceae bacterium]